MNQPPTLATVPVAVDRPHDQVPMPVAPKPVFVQPKLTKQGSVATLTQDFSGSFDPGP